jgi:beta-galactosidase
VLTAIGLEDGKEIERKVLGTSGAPAGIQLTAEQQEIKAGRDVIAYVQVEAIDEAGNLVPDASLRVSVTVSGPAEILAAGNASPDQMESLKDPAFNTFRGKALVIIRSDGNAGNITITAEAEGLMPGSVTVIALK